MTFPSLFEHDEFFADQNNALDANLARNWSQGAQFGLGCTYASPVRWAVSGCTNAVTDYLQGVHRRWLNRIMDRDLNDPTLDPLSTNHLGLSLPDAQHFCIRPLADAVQMFTDVPGNAIDFGRIALDVVRAYYISEKWTYLRDGGAEKRPYGVTGRCRTAGWILHTLRDVLVILKNLGAPQAAKNFVLDLANQHVQRITAHWPLIDAPQGDHLPCNHIPTFNLGILASGALDLGDVTRELYGIPAPGATDVAIRAVEMIEGFAWASDGVWYDIPFSGEASVSHPMLYRDLSPEIQDDMRKQTAVGQTHIWCAYPVREVAARQHRVSEMSAWQLDLVRKSGWFDREHPVEVLKWRLA